MVISSPRPSNPREAAFLRRQQSRLQALHQHPDHGDYNNKSQLPAEPQDVEWLDQQLVEWKTQVEALLKTITATPPELKGRPRHGEYHWQLMQYQQELYALRNTFLSWSSSSTIMSSDNQNDTYAHYHDELVACQAQWDKVHHILQEQRRHKQQQSEGGRRKFTFRRYHQAILERQQQQPPVPSVTEAESPSSSLDVEGQQQTNVKTLSPMVNSTTVQGYRHVCIDIYPTRVVLRNRIHNNTLVDRNTNNDDINSQDQTLNDETTKEDDKDPTVISLDRPQTVFAHLEDCEIFYRLGESMDDSSIPTLASVQMVHCDNVCLSFGGDLLVCSTSKESASPRVTATTGSSPTPSSAWHAQTLFVSDCTHCSFEHGRLQQVRLHRSSHMLCHSCIITAGAILEGCRAVEFRVQQHQVHKDDIDTEGPLSTPPPLLCIRDFDWLQPNTPSPNFTIVYLKDDDKALDTESTNIHSGEQPQNKHQERLTSPISMTRPDVLTPTSRLVPADISHPNGDPETLSNAKQTTVFVQTHHETGSSVQLVGNRSVQDDDDDGDDDDDDEL